MDYGKRGVKIRQKQINAKGGKFGRKLFLLILCLLISAFVAICVWATSLGVGAFKAILAETPTVRISDIIATGQATIVFDADGNEIDQYVSMDSNRIEVTWDEIPEQLGQAFVALEDERFYQHNGIDYKGIVRAGYNYIISGGKVAQGASTITQQLLKNTIFTDWTSEGDNRVKKIKRKIQEQYLALEVTKNTEKNEILLRYMNAINLGQSTLGVESASQRYFGKSCIDLTLSECAVIAGITQNPSYYNPLRNPKNNKVRREKCLKNMKEQGYITEAEYQTAMSDTDAVYERISYHDTVLSEENSTSASYFSDAVYEQVLDDLVAAGYDNTVAEHMLNSGGLRIYSTMDPAIQKIVDEEYQNPDNFSPKTHWYLNYALTITDEDEVKHNYSKENMMSWFKANGQSSFNLIFSDQEAADAAIEKYRNAMFAELEMEPSDKNYEENITLIAQPQVAMVIEDQSTGYVVAMEGGRGAKEGRRTLNRATNAYRSPGSTFKVLASFAPALDACGFTLATVYNDAAFNYNDGRPVSNWYHGYYRGICSIRYAVEQSLNIIAVKNETVIGARLGYDYLLDFGFTTLTDGKIINGKVYSDVNQTLALGGLTNGVSPYELNAAYAAIANEGVYVTPKLYTKVTDSDDNIILDNRVPTSRRVIKETTAWLLTSAMHDVVTKGTGGRANLSNIYVAGKTGTSSDYKDVWFVGYTGYYTAAVWTGYDNAIGMSTATSNDESAISKKMWKAVMSRVHEGKESITPTMPSNIVKVTVCSQSGKLPVAGLCDGTLIEEFFEEGTEPTEYCDVHYSGEICGYEGKIACAECPFKYTGVAILPLVEPEALLAGSTMIITNEDGTQTITSPMATNYCQHNAEFFANPNYESILIQQQNEMVARQEAAIQAQMQSELEQQQ